MKAGKFSDAQIAFVLKQAEDGTPIDEVCRKARIAESTFNGWRKLDLPRFSGETFTQRMRCWPRMDLTMQKAIIWLRSLKLPRGMRL